MSARLHWVHTTSRNTEDDQLTYSFITPYPIKLFSAILCCRNFYMVEWVYVTTMMQPQNSHTLLYWTCSHVMNATTMIAIMVITPYVSSPTGRTWRATPGNTKAMAALRDAVDNACKQCVWIHHGDCTRWTRKICTTSVLVTWGCPSLGSSSRLLGSVWHSSKDLCLYEHLWAVSGEPKQKVLCHSMYPFEFKWLYLQVPQCHSVGHMPGLWLRSYTKRYSTLFPKNCQC